MEGLEKAILVLLKELGVPGAIVSIKSKLYGDLEILYGYAKIETKEPMKIGLPFRIGSITKTFTGIMALQLYDEGKIVLDDPINDILLGIPNGKNITTREVGAMRSGLFNFSELPEFQAIVKENPYRIWVQDEMLLLGVNHEVYFPPGEGFHYSNTNTIILACAIERLADGSYEQELCERMFNPLCLKNTYYAAFIKEPCINGYVAKDNGKFMNVTEYNDSWAWSAGEIISTVGDMHKYLKKSIANHQTLSDDATAQQRYWQTSEEVNPSVIRRYGFHLMKLNNYLGHNGSLPGYNSFILYSLQTQTSVVIVCNIQNSISELGPANEIAYLIVAALQ